MSEFCKADQSLEGIEQKGLVANPRKEEPRDKWGIKKGLMTISGCWTRGEVR